MNFAFLIEIGPSGTTKWGLTIFCIVVIVVIVFMSLGLYDFELSDSFECYTCHTKLDHYKDADFLKTERGPRHTDISYYTYSCYRCSHKGRMKEVVDRKWLSYGYKAIT